MARPRQVLTVIGLLLVAVVLISALYYGSQRDKWSELVQDELYTSTDARLSHTTEEGIRTASKMRKVKVVSNESDKDGEWEDPTQDSDQSSLQEHESLLPVSRGQPKLNTVGGGDEESNSSADGPPADAEYVAKLVTDDHIGRTPNFTDSLSRLASTLNFDYSSCPKDSLVRTTPPAATLKPKHPDCPGLFIIGARKGGTTSLIQYLSKHPHFVGARLKGNAKAGETMYYTVLYKKKNWKDFMSFFPPPVPGVLTGESSVAYATRCPVPMRIVEDCGTKPKIVYLIRNPYRRFESNYLMRLRFHPGYPGINEVFQKQWKSLMRALNGSMSLDGEIRKGASLYEDFSCKWESNSPNMLYDSLYYVFLSHWLCNYPSPENIMIVNSEEFFEKPGRILNQIFTFLGLSELTEDSLSTIVSSVYNQGTHRDVGIAAESRKLLEKLYGPFTKEILSLLKWNVDWSP